MSSEDNDVFKELITFYTPGDETFGLVREFCVFESFICLFYSSRRNTFSTLVTQLEGLLDLSELMMLVSTNLVGYKIPAQFYRIWFIHFVSFLIVNVY